MSVCEAFNHAPKPKLVVPKGVEEVTAYFAAGNPPEMTAYMAQHIHVRAARSPEAERKAVEQLAITGALGSIQQLVEVAPHTVPGLARWVFYRATTQSDKDQAADCVVDALTRLMTTHPAEAIASSLWAEQHFPKGVLPQLVSIVAEASRAGDKISPRLAQEASEWVKARSKPCPKSAWISCSLGG